MAVSAAVPPPVLLDQPLPVGDATLLPDTAPLCVALGVVEALRLPAGETDAALEGLGGGVPVPKTDCVRGAVP